MMITFAFQRTEIAGLIKVTPFFSDDERGSFIKDYSREIFAQNNLDHELKEVFYTASKKGVVRGIHFQQVKQQVKLVRCVSGHIFDVVVDLRKDSPTFQQWLAFELSGENMHELLIPEGCGHGFMALEESIVSYKCSEKFYSEYDSGIKWNDPDISIAWPTEKVSAPLILSNKDKHLQTFQQFMDSYGGF